jgi:hypothetical protein
MNGDGTMLRDLGHSHSVGFGEDSESASNRTQWNVSLRSIGSPGPRSVNIAPCSLIHSECRAFGPTRLARLIRTHSGNPEGEGVRNDGAPAPLSHRADLRR